ncbi:MAG: peptidase [Lachnospiraceae bacterium]
MFDTLKEYLKAFFRLRLVPVTAVYLILFAILVNRMFQIQITGSETYAKDTSEGKIKVRTIKASRGNIYDCNGKLLAYNKLAYNVIYAENETTGKLSSEEKNIMVYNTIKIIENNGGTLSVETFMQAGKNGKLEFTVDGSALLRFKAEIYSAQGGVDALSEEQRESTAEELYDFINSSDVNSPRFAIDSGKFDPQTAMKILAVRYAIFIKRFHQDEVVTLAKDVNDKTVAAIKENNNEIPGVDIMEDTVRVYKKSKYFAHIIGYTGAVSSEKLAELKKGGNNSYTDDDQIGISGIENTFEDELKGKKGRENLIVTSGTNRVKEIADRKDPVAGNNIYLSIDSELQEECYKLLEEHIAGILVTSMHNSADAGTKGESAAGIKIPVYDVYNALIQNNLVNVMRFTDKSASKLEKSTYKKYKEKSRYIIKKLKEILKTGSTKTAKNMPEDMAEFTEYFYKLLSDKGIVLKDDIDTTDATYKKYAAGKLGLSQFLQYAISKNWVDLKVLNIGDKYYSTSEIYEMLIKYGIRLLKEDTGYVKMVYSYLIYHYELSGRDCCLLMFDQGNIKYNAGEYESLEKGLVSAYSFLVKKIKKLEITPGQLGLEPCSGSLVVTDVNTGKVKAMVTYPSYDNNKMANKVDSEYYNTYLMQNKSSPMLNKPVQQAMAPGSTFKLLSSVTGLEEGVISPGTTIYDGVVFDKIDHPAKCWSSSSHGSVNVSSAIGVSCNYFFYTVGYMLSGKTSNGNINYQRGIEKLRKYAELFGLTDKSGVEIPEISPTFASADAVRAAIGQDTNAYTPAQISRYVTSVANSGTTYNLTLIDKIKNVKGKTVLDNKAETRNKVKIADSTWDAVHNGMYLVVNGPRSSIKSMFTGLNVTIAGKTGTAQQTKSHPNHAWFVSYAPYNNPEISVTCNIPNGYTSSNAAQTARDVYKYYFSNKGKKNKERKKVSGSIKMPESGSQRID